MSPLHALAIFAAGVVAGTINTVVGSGTLFTFPVLLGFGYAPVVANVSNTVGLIPGSAAGAFGYRRELAGQGRRSAPLALASLLGGITGAVLLLSLAPAGLIAGGSLLGGLLGARAGRRLSPRMLRGVIVVVGIVAIVRLLA